MTEPSVTGDALHAGGVTGNAFDTEPSVTGNALYARKRRLVSEATADRHGPRFNQHDVRSLRPPV